MFQRKICGITTAEDAQAMIAAGADALGLNFYPKSKRFLRPEVAADVRHAISPETAAVGLFVNADVVDVVATAKRLALDWVQLHGDEPPEYLARLRHLGSPPVLKAFRCGPGWKEEIAQFLSRCADRECSPPAILIDGFQQDAYGGTGQTADWESLEGWSSWLSALECRYLVLAGGLTPDNVSAAIANVQPTAVDTASGVESEPGRKDPVLAARFCANAKAAMGV
ncbi:phosphoribosylanthranilate isomerase [Blastopirellula sp. JC732]|uniref:N-(5'-phosphoribosyl)anthranilate isomerase n=1 Tax=Blastopirellula sediminis TaxID=2894196 RepID=A0A9X1SGY2_9BACT|nr:phosphoribosylanthranilate isomerase [Blastopirellula sediminis]MCC9604269.1 phosphoribosylanthranilate isomerase [Blastopirellula sediminis]MCC9626789.1 phosphoribosylanthranilate isomerase [Blastopirellula sediminis]